MGDVGAVTAPRRRGKHSRKEIQSCQAKTAQAPRAKARAQDEEADDNVPPGKSKRLSTIEALAADPAREKVPAPVKDVARDEDKARDAAGDVEGDAKRALPIH